MYQYRAATVFFEDIQANQGATGTADFLAVNLTGNARTLLAFFGTRSTFGGTPPSVSGYTNRKFDFGGVGASHSLGVYDKENTGTDGAVTMTGSTDGWATIHVSMASPSGSNQIL